MTCMISNRLWYNVHMNIYDAMGIGWMNFMPSWFIKIFNK